MGLARGLGIACALAMGLGAFTATQVVMAKDATIKKYQFYCIQGNVTKLKEAGLHSYEPMLGGFFTCILTQFMLALTEDPAGMLAWGLIATLIFPMFLLMYAEAGRYGATGLVKWPVLVLFLGQFLGISTTFPVMWVPAALMGQGTGVTSKGRIWMTILLVVPSTLVQLYVFFGDSDTRAWTICAGLLTGPGLPLLGILLWPFPSPGSEKPAGAEQSIRLLKGAYRAFMLPAAAGYYFLIYHAYLHYQTPKEMIAALWGPKADGSVMFMTVDSCVLTMALLLYLLMTSPCGHVVLTVLFAPVIGPAAAICAALGQREANRLTELCGEGRALVWVDCEMTGLGGEGGPGPDTLLEVAVIVTDGDLNVVAEGPDLVIHQPDEVLDGMNDWCKRQFGWDSASKSAEPGYSRL
ncbi:REXO2 [Symbiodinium natans]|uniref:REXO2 protein n=1 Tax=Symbiodinium natans TaxID=878477 RepID=A0A812K8S2_9DINO|nr:REXO2 [Symbiodinium natans]